MSKSLRLSEAWFRRGLWLVAVLFAGFLTSLGSAVVGDLPKVESRRSAADFEDRARLAQLRGEQKTAQRAQQDAQAALEQARLAQQVAAADTRNARQAFEAWLATRRATERAEQDPQVIERTRQLEALQQAERSALAVVERQQQAQLDARQREATATRAIGDLQETARQAWQAEQRQVELRVFLYRLALTLPLLVAAGWLLRRHRQGRWWPFVWGFAIFAGFTFFFELVPYLPSWGGYVRSVVGVVVTLVAGRQAILALERYRQRQQQAEAQSEGERRRALAYDTALARLAKGVCPGCERAVDLKTPGLDWCPHCGIGLHDHCGRCGSRKNAFARYCVSCGAPAAVDASPAPAAGAAPATPPAGRAIPGA
jgi:hypothetical protein